MQTLIDARALSKLRWRCRRGLLENDLFVERFFERHGAMLTEAQARGLEALMDLPDNDLRELLRDDVVQVLRMMRRPQ
jgi:antitoxin CptB